MEYADLMKSEWGLALLTAEPVATLLLGWGTLHERAQSGILLWIGNYLRVLHHLVNSED